MRRARSYALFTVISSLINTIMLAVTSTILFRLFTRLKDNLPPQTRERSQRSGSQDETTQELWGRVDSLEEDSRELKRDIREFQERIYSQGESGMSSSWSTRRETERETEPFQATDDQRQKQRVPSGATPSSSSH
ncbi:hypothetical protein KY386_02435 [Candidatus Parcubacteria bacterium]|nr:hypothetical protein [Candidatus Parcubacteria bacterium]